MANRNTNPGSGKDDNEMRIQFGMILSSLRRRRINKNMIRTDSQDYGADEILYTTWKNQGTYPSRERDKLKIIGGYLIN